MAQINTGSGSNPGNGFAGYIKRGLHEVRCAEARGFASAAGFALGMLARFGNQKGSGRIVWVIDPAASVDTGVPFPDGLSQHGIDPQNLTFVRPLTLHDALWAADQAAKCADLCAIILQVRGNPKRFDLTASRRLMLRARESGAVVCVLRQSGEEEASAAATRWHVEVTPSIPDPGFPQGLGITHHHLTLEKNRHGQTGQWSSVWNPESKAFEDGPSPDKPAHRVHRLHPSAHRPDRPAQMGQVVEIGRAS
jgi:protein ImuA